MSTEVSADISPRMDERTPTHAVGARFRDSGLRVWMTADARLMSALVAGWECRPAPPRRAPDTKVPRPMHPRPENSRLPESGWSSGESRRSAAQEPLCSIGVAANCLRGVGRESGFGAPSRPVHPGLLFKQTHSDEPRDGGPLRGAESLVRTFVARPGEYAVQHARGC